MTEKQLQILDEVRTLARSACTQAGVGVDPNASAADCAGALPRSEGDQRWRSCTVFHAALTEAMGQDYLDQYHSTRYCAGMAGLLLAPALDL